MYVDDCLMVNQSVKCISLAYIQCHYNIIWQFSYWTSKATPNASIYVDPHLNKLFWHNNKTCSTQETKPAEGKPICTSQICPQTLLWQPFWFWVRSLIRVGSVNNVMFFVYSASREVVLVDRVTPKGDNLSDIVEC